MIALDEIDDGRTGGGDEAFAWTLGQKLAIGAGHKIRAERHLAHQREAELAQRPDQVPRITAADLCRKTRRHTRRHARATVQEPIDLLD